MSENLRGGGEQAGHWIEQFSVRESNARGVFLPGDELVDLSDPFDVRPDDVTRGGESSDHAPDAAQQQTSPEDPNQS